MNEKNVSKKKLLKSFFWKILFLIIFIIAFIWSLELEHNIKMFVLVIISIILAIIIVNLLLTLKQYNNYQYLLSEEEIVIKTGVVFKSTTIIPYCQIQDISYTQGPIDLALNIADVIISTAGPVDVIKSLDKEIALELVNFLKKQICIKKENDKDEIL